MNPGDNFDFGWFVGMFEGEGSTFIDTNGKRAEPVPVLVVQMTDEDSIRRLHRVAGCGSVQGPYLKADPSHKPYWRWRTRNTGDVLYLLNAMYPHLSERRRGQADVVIAWDASRPHRYAAGRRATLEAARVS